MVLVQKKSQEVANVLKIDCKTRLAGTDSPVFPRRAQLSNLWYPLLCQDLREESSHAPILANGKQARIIIITCLASVKAKEVVRASAAKVEASICGGM